MSKKITWIATAVTIALPVTLLFCRMNTKRKQNLLNRRYSNDDLMFDI